MELERPSVILRGILERKFDRKELTDMTTDLIKKLSPNMQNVVGCCLVGNMSASQILGPDAAELSPYNIAYIGCLAMEELGLDPSKPDIEFDDALLAYLKIMSSLESTQVAVRFPSGTQTFLVME